MDLLPVISSNVSAIGYLQEECLLRIRFVDGSVYDYPGIPSDQYRALMLSDSKGKWIRANLKEKGIRNHTFTKEVADEKLEPLGAEPQGDTLSAPLPLFTIDLEAGHCCNVRLSNLLGQTAADKLPPSWACPICGLYLVPRPLPASQVVHWQIQIRTFVVRR